VEEDLVLSSEEMAAFDAERFAYLEEAEDVDENEKSAEGENDDLNEV
jgi:hypothetical protein